MWAYLKCVEMGKLDSGMGIYTSHSIHNYQRGKITLIVFFFRNRRWVSNRENVKYKMVCTTDLCTVSELGPRSYGDGTSV